MRLITLLLLICLECGCDGAGPRWTVDSKRTVEMVVALPNPVRTPRKIEIFRTGLRNGKDGFGDFSKPSKRRFLLLESEDPAQIESLVETLRARTDFDARTRTVMGFSYHIVFHASDGTNLLYYIGFVPKSDELDAFVRPNTPSGFAYSCRPLREWLKSHNLLE